MLTPEQCDAIREALRERTKELCASPELAKAYLAKLFPEKPDKKAHMSVRDQIIDALDPDVLDFCAACEKTSPPGSKESLQWCAARLAKLGEIADRVLALEPSLRSRDFG